MNPSFLTARAVVLAALVAALQHIDPADAPPRRGILLAERDPVARYWLARYSGDPAATEAWERALAAPSWDGMPVWHHGDLGARNWLARAGSIRGVIDWGEMGARVRPGTQSAWPPHRRGVFHHPC